MNTFGTGVNSLFGPRSLRTRFLYAASLLAVVVLTSAWLGGRNVSEITQRSMINVGERKEVQQDSKLLRIALWDARYDIQVYVLTGGTPEREAVFKNLDGAGDITRRLRASSWVNQHRLIAEVDNIAEDLAELSRESRELIEVRQNVHRLLPSLSLLDDVLAPSSRQFLIAARLVLDELEGRSSAEHARIRQVVEGVRDSWTEMINAFQIDMPRHVGVDGAGQTSDKESGSDVTLLYQQMSAQFGKLGTLVEQLEPRLRNEEPLRQMELVAMQWFDGFNQYRLAQESGNWRSDIPKLEARIRPLFEHVNNMLDQIDARVESSAQDEVVNWSGFSQQLIQNIWVLSLIAFCLITLTFWYIERTMLEPLAGLGRAMKAVARGEDHADLPDADSLEARDLIEAFAHMQSKVQDRQDQLERQTLHDALTGLPNRLLLLDRLKREVLNGKRNGPPFCLLIMDLDRFKEINDSLGHQTGDRVLCEVGSRLQNLLRMSDTVARMGGDEFAVLLADTSVRQAQDIANKIADTLEQPFEFDDKHLLLGVSIGIAASPDHGKDVNSLIKRADVAMYVAKQNGLPYSVYNVQQDRHSVGRLALISELRDAIKNDKFCLHYQPKVDMRTNEVVGVEALLRWPDWSTIPTRHLIETAEQTGLIRPLTHWVLRNAVKQYSHWQRKSYDLPLSVNLSNWMVQQVGLAEHISVLLDEFKVPATALEMEITENAVVQNPERALAAFRELHGIGVRLTLDDYGTGFSSLAYLKQMAVEQIKIDTSFVMQMAIDDDSAVIVRSTIELAHNLGLRVVAEGVSNKEVWDLLAGLNCDTAQGYYVAEPMSAEALEAWLAGRGFDQLTSKPASA